jgi:2-polyprenyl-3-methyl-5-hydroxy-6-metoxy-1,4-benzoquinol methylase
MIAAGDRIAVAYDAIAAEYDVQLERNPVAAYMRKRLHRHFAATFHPGDRVLDLTAGTGLDALFLAAQGIQVSALDVSSRMIAELQRNAAKSGLHIEARVLSAEYMDEPGGYYAGAISTFAGLNTIHDMPALAESLAHSLHPHGRVILHGLNEFCLWQAAANLLRRHADRDGMLRIGGEGVQHRLYAPLALWRQAFAPYFRLRQAYALSVVAAPPFIKRFPRIAPFVFQVDRLLGYAFPSSGDFFVLDLERRW